MAVQKAYDVKFLQFIILFSLSSLDKTVSFFFEQSQAPFPVSRVPPSLHDVMEAAGEEYWKKGSRYRRSAPINQTQQDLSKKQSTKIARLIEGLLKNYDLYIRPGFGALPQSGQHQFCIKSSGAPLVVESNMVLTSMGPFSDFEASDNEEDRKMTVDTESGIQVSGSSGKHRKSGSLIPEFTFQCFFRHYWKDLRLAFDESEASELVLNSIMLDKVWKPDTFFRGNGQNSYIHDITRPNQLFRLKYTGQITFSSRLTISARCPMNFAAFPMDTQTCTIEFSSFGYPDTELLYRWALNEDGGGQVTIEPLAGELAQFTLFRTTTGGSTLVSKDDGNYSFLCVEFLFKRNLGYFIMQTYLPCMMIVGLSWVAFWINREAAPARISLGITTVLTMTTFAISSRQQIPKVSYPSSMDWFVLVSYLFVFCALVEYAAVNYFTKRGEGGKLPKQRRPSGPPAKKPRIDGMELGNNISVEPHYPQENCDDDLDEETPPFSNMDSFLVKFLVCLCGSIKYRQYKIDHISTQFNSVSHIDEICRIGFPLSFGIFNAIYWSIYLLPDMVLGTTLNNSI